MRTPDFSKPQMKLGSGRPRVVTKSGDAAKENGGGSPGKNIRFRAGVVLW
jgi:hypothetical protein